MGMRDLLKNVITLKRIRKRPDYREKSAAPESQHFLLWKRYGEAPLAEDQRGPSLSQKDTKVNYPTGPGECQARAQTVIIDGKTLEVVVEGPYHETQLPRERRVSILTSIISPALRTGLNTARVIVSCAEETAVRITYVDEHGRSMREDRVPQLAQTTAYSDAEKVMNSMQRHGFDDEILTALKDRVGAQRSKVGLKQE